MAVIKVTDTNQFNQLFTEHEYVLVDFYADWCPPCRMMSPVIDRFSEDPDLQRITFVKVNVDENPMLASQFGVQGIPTFILFKSLVKSQDESQNSGQADSYQAVDPQDEPQNESQDSGQGDIYQIINRFVGGQEPLGFKSKLLATVK